MVGQRMTRQRVAIAELLEDVDEFHSAQQIHQMLQQRGQEIGLATVYRTLNAMAEKGDLEVLLQPTGEHTYLRCEPRSEHHHHLVCRVCGRTVEVAAPELEQLVDALAAGHDFTDVEHSIDFVGTCRDCARAGRSHPRS
ncbi:transcriptional repressor [Cellulomonas sp. zg-ZUI199]|uniref:Transcriptional repressor n=1 Tax=Cellulomonas wangleii TaxID=2816956 RepID=A0ABX8D1Q3_9CELL|nr:MULTISPECIES: Fur family transcriptional regulator [Cellulomonas]MBO0899847.1 transcriptional repressor [Cellulomonas sp. zg-ZUI22]MBO0922874.1 transcriptional repressor [Cellulomonas wangleii]QVI61274.1 transcriptional repressor [Cellulomonas wangleii]